MIDADPVRVLPLEGVRNFRDLGGYATSDGRRVRWRQLFRSASLGSLTARDHAALDALGLRAVFDLRATDERAREPVRWSTGAGPRILQHDYLLDLGALSRVLPRADADVAAGRGAFAEFYAAMPTRFATAYRALFGALARGEAPFAINCSAGKDRTGVGAALVLAALGVPRATIIEDYLLSNLHYRPGPEVAASMVERLQIVHYAVSLGHHRSLVYWIGTDDIQQSTFRHDAEQRRRYRAYAGDGVFRLSVGIEDADDLIADLSRALD